MKPFASLDTTCVNSTQVGRNTCKNHPASCLFRFSFTSKCLTTITILVLASRIRFNDCSSETHKTSRPVRNMQLHRWLCGGLVAPATAVVRKQCVQKAPIVLTMSAAVNHVRSWTSCNCQNQKQWCLKKSVHVLMTPPMQVGSRILLLHQWLVFLSAKWGPHFEECEQQLFH